MQYKDHLEAPKHPATLSHAQAYDGAGKDPESQAWQRANPPAHAPLLCGLTRKVFTLVLIALIAVLAIALGAGLGVGLSHNSDSSPSPAPAPAPSGTNGTAETPGPAPDSTPAPVPTAEPTPGTAPTLTPLPVPDPAPDSELPTSAPTPATPEPAPAPSPDAAPAQPAAVPTPAPSRRPTASNSSNASGASILTPRQTAGGQLLLSRGGGPSLEGGKCASFADCAVRNSSCIFLWKNGIQDKASGFCAADKLPDNESCNLSQDCYSETCAETRVEGAGLFCAAQKGAPCSRDVQCNYSCRLPFCYSPL